MLELMEIREPNFIKRRCADSTFSRRIISDATFIKVVFLASCYVFINIQCRWRKRLRLEISNNDAKYRFTDICGKYDISLVHILH